MRIAVGLTLGGEGRIAQRADPGRIPFGAPTVRASSELGAPLSAQLTTSADGPVLRLGIEHMFV